MPTSDEYIIYEDTGTPIWSYSTSNRIQQMWEEHQREYARQDREIERQLQEEAELAEDRRKYPLFFWKENI